MARGEILFDLGQYTFTSWARRGVANQIPATDNSKVRAQIDLSITLNNELLPSQSAELLGPADVASIARNAIVRTAPHDRNFTFEWNLLPYIEFYDEDFLWRFTPEAEINGNLRPWLALVVAKENEFSNIPQPNGALAAVRLQTHILPSSAEGHLWAHMHTGKHAGVENSAANAAALVKQISDNYPKDPDGFTCRLLSPRRLEPLTRYFAFLIPSYETGRLAGLGEIFDQIGAKQAAWTDNNRPATLDFPVYHQWEFATSEDSFEDLVSKLKTTSANPNVGIRDMNTANAGYMKANSTAPVGKTTPSVLGLEGALRTPATQSTAYVADGASDVFQKDVKDLLDLYDRNSSTQTPQYSDELKNGDPILTIPLYGHAYANPKLGAASPKPLTRDGKNWYSAINYDPRNRVAAGLGTQVVQKEQEELMQSAWLQLAALQRAKNNFAAVGVVMERFQNRLLNTELVETEDFIALSRNITKRVVATEEGTTAKTTLITHLTKSLTPNALLNSGTKRLLRSNGAFVTRLNFKPPAGLLPINKTIYKNIGGVVNTAVDKYRGKYRNVRDVVVFNPPVPNPTPEQKAFALAFDQLIKRMPIPLSTVNTKPFNFIYAKSMITAAFNIAPTHLLKAKINLPVSQTVQNTARPPAEFLGQAVFTQPMYEPLWQLDKEWLLPNLNLIENNSLTVLETNPHFINGYMLGLNHELGREMLWRSYPADLSATFFRQFWSAPDQSMTPQYGDIEPITKWLGATATPRQSLKNSANIVLTLRGDLLRKFPNTVIFMARLKRKGNGNLEPLTAENCRFPLFSATLPPDLSFIGFDVTTSQIQSGGGGGANGEWFFIVMEPVGEPHFGLDAVFRTNNNTGQLTRDDLAWEHLRNPNLPDFITANNKPNLPNLVAEDKNIWGADAASMARLLFQQPFALFVKAADLLPKA